MGTTSGIEWCDSSFNGWSGCTAVSPCCTNCYAEALGKRLGTLGGWGSGVARRRTGVKNWNEPLRWNEAQWWECPACGWRGAKVVEDTFLGARCPDCPFPYTGLNLARRRVFSASLSDWLDNEVPAEWLADLLDLVRRTSRLDWLLLTKRIGLWRARLLAARAVAVERDASPLVAWLDEWLAGRPPGNVWVGATVGDQTEADRDVPKLLQVPARVRFLSIEPMLGPINIRRWLSPRQSPNADGYGGEHAPGWTTDFTTVDWVICGGESGPGARPVNPEWVRSLRDQCQSASVPFLFKQWGEYSPGPVVLAANFAGGAYIQPAVGPATAIARASAVDHGNGYGSVRVGKRASGRLLDGREHLEWPVVGDR